MLGFTRTDDEFLVSCLGDPPRAVAAYRELLRRGKNAVGAIHAGLHHEYLGVREGCCRLLDHLALALPNGTQLCRAVEVS